MALTATIPGKTKHGDAILVRPHRSKNLIPADTYIHKGNKSRLQSKLTDFLSCSHFTGSFNCSSLKCRQEKCHIQLQQTGCFLSNFPQLSQTVTLCYFFLQYHHDTFYWVMPGMIGAVQPAQRKSKSSSSTTFGTLRPLKSKR